MFSTAHSSWFWFENLFLLSEWMICLVALVTIPRRKDSEISLLVYDPDVVAEMTGAQERYVGKSTRLTAREWNRRHPIRKTVQSIARLADALL